MVEEVSRFADRVLAAPLKGLTMTGTSQGSAYPESGSTVETFTFGVSPSGSPDTCSPGPFAPGEWDAIVAAAVAAVEAAEAADSVGSEDTSGGGLSISALLEAQPSGARTYTLPIEPGATARVPTWHSRKYWMSLCRWVVTNTDRGVRALKRHAIAADTFLRGCNAHADAAESTTGRRVAVSLDTLVNRSGLSVDQLKRCRRVMRTLEIGVEQARGKKLNATERAAAAHHYEQVHGHPPVRLQTGAASVWSLSAPKWAVLSMPISTRRRPRPSTRRRTRRAASVTAKHCTSPTPPSASSRAPQSPRGFSLSNLSVRKDHQARTRAEDINQNPTGNRPLNLQRAAAELVLRIPALGRAPGLPQRGSSHRSHIGTVCDLLVRAGIDTDRWTGTDIANALNRDGNNRGWTWPAAVSITSPFGLVEFRLSRLDWSGASPTELKIGHSRRSDESPVTAAHRLMRARRAHLLGELAPKAPPASAAHRGRLKDAFAAEQTARARARQLRGSQCQTAKGT